MGQNLRFLEVKELIKKQIHKQISQWLLMFLSVLLIVASGLSLLDNLYPTKLYNDKNYSQIIFDKQGKHLRRFTTKNGYWRFPVDLNKIDKEYLDLLFAYEDKRFYQHMGVDWLAMLRASWQLISETRIVSGGSTITMQLARLLEPKLQSRTLLSKLKQVLRGWQLEWQFSKKEILTRYLELAPFGGNIQGIRAASLFYFGKEPRFLSLHESALLVALPQSPETRRPDKFPLKARNSRDNVVKRLHSLGRISSKQKNQVLAEDVPKKRQQTPFYAPHLADKLRKIGNTIHTTLDAEIQSQLESILNRYQQRQPQGVTLAAIVVENDTYKVRAYAGSGNYFSQDFPGQVNMLEAIRSPGSTLKPFIFGLGFDKQLMHPLTLVSDNKLTVDGYSPENFDGKYLGNISMTQALLLSRNLPAVRALQKIGVDRFVEQLSQVNVSLYFPKDQLKSTLPVALGGVGIRFVDLVSLYVALANQGQHQTLQYLQNNNESASESNKSSANLSREAISEQIILEETISEIVISQLLTAQSTWYLTNILAQAKRPINYTQVKQELAFKTGTSYGYRDAWAIGYDDKYTIAIWLGRPDGGYTPRLFGLKDAVPVMMDMFALLPPSGLTSLLKENEPNFKVTSYKLLPHYLQQLNPSSEIVQSTVDSKVPKITFPVHHSKLIIDKGKMILIEATGGQSPYHWLENGKLLYQTVQPQLLWKPKTLGSTTLTLLDNNGHSASVSFTLDVP